VERGWLEQLIGEQPKQNTERQVDKMAYSKRGRRDGTGPFKESYQRRLSGRKGKRQLSGMKCPKRKGGG